MHLLYLVFGTNIKNHFQANFSILSFLRQQETLDGITIATDAPDFYQHLTEHVTVLVIDEATLHEWKGEFDFFWRIKIKALEYVSQQRPGTAVLYLDSDTFLYGSLSQLRVALAAGSFCMHEPEGTLATLSSKTERRMWQQVRQQTFGGIQLHEGHVMWNAGVVGIPAATATKSITLALQICDDMSRQQVTPRLIEQFALSVALAETGPMQAAAPYIGHYWSTKEEWNEAITAFLLESHLCQRSVADEVVAIAHFDYQAIPIKQRVKSTQDRLEKLVRRLFPPQNIIYLPPGQ